MASKNVETLRAAHESWNRRDFDGTVSAMTDNVAYTDHARNLQLRSRNEFKDWAIAWAKAFSDGKIVNPRYIDAGDTVIATFTLALAAGAGYYDAARLANYAGGIVVMKYGTRPVTYEELKEAVEDNKA